MSGKILLVLCNSNYGDEFDVQGFALFKDDVWKEYIKEVKNRIFTVERYAGDEFGPHVADIGTNQYIGFGNFDEYKSSFRTKVLTPEEAKRLRSLFGIKVNKSAEDPSVYGMFLMLNPDEVEDEEYEDEDEDVFADEEEDEEDIEKFITFARGGKLKRDGEKNMQ